MKVIAAAANKNFFRAMGKGLGTGAAAGNRQGLAHRCPSREAMTYADARS
jgi:hypothetical protein